MAGNQLTFGSVCSGVDGLGLGLEWAGWQPAWHIENNKFCNTILNEHYPYTTKYTDIHLVKAEELEPVNLLCGGIPCQPFSHAGQRAGTTDNRWLWPGMLRLIQSVQPRLVLVENVYGLVTNRGGVVLETIYSDLEANDYETAPPFVLPACASGDTVHRRDRVWICAHARHNWRSAQPREQQALRAEESNRVCEMVRTSRGWEAQPGLGRIIDGFPSRLDNSRFRAIGGAVVPQAARDIGLMLRKSIGY